MAPAPLKTPRGDRLAFITYYKGEYLLHSRDTAEPLKEVEQEVQSAAEGLVDFQPDVTHEVVPENKRRKKLFEGLYLEGRPPLNVGVTSSGNFYGGTAVALTDVLGDQLFSFAVMSVSSYRVYTGSYTNLASRLHYGVNLFDQTQFFYPYYAQYSQYYGQDPRDLAIATQRFTGGQVFAQYPLDTFRRVEMGLGIIKVAEQYGDQGVEELVCQQSAIAGLPCFINNGWQLPVSAAHRPGDDPVRRVRPALREHLLRGRDRGPGHRELPAAHDGGRRPAQVPPPRAHERARRLARAGGSTRPATTPTTSSSAATWRCGATPTTASPATRASSRTPSSGSPLINLAATPIGIIGPLRGTVYFGVSGAQFKGQPYQFSTKEPGYSYVKDPIFGEPVDRLATAGRASLLGLRAAAVLPRLPDALRLDEVHGLRHDQPGLGLRFLDRVRLLDAPGAWGAGCPPRSPSLLARRCGFSPGPSPLTTRSCSGREGPRRSRPVPAPTAGASDAVPPTGGIHPPGPQGLDATPETCLELGFRGLSRRRRGGVRDHQDGRQAVPGGDRATSCASSGSRGRSGRA